jgi:hypothetical protein
MSLLKTPPSDPVRIGDADQSLDRRIASLRHSIERESRNGEVSQPKRWSPSPRRFLRPGGIFRQASRVLRRHAFEIHTYGFGVAVAVVVGWLIASRL